MSFLKLLAASASALVLFTACNPLRPHDGRSTRETSQVAVAFDPTDVGPLAARMKTLLIHVSKVENGSVLPTTQIELRLPIVPQQADYIVTGVTLGLKEFKVFLLDEADVALGSGSIQHDVKPGENRTGTLVIKLNPIEQPVIDTPVELAVSLAAEGGDGAITDLVKKIVLKFATASGAAGEIELTSNSGAALVSYEQLKPIIDERCVSCHSVDYAAKKLELDQYPFKSGNIADQAKLLDEIMKRIVDADEPMPPKSAGGLMPEGEIAQWTSWKASGFAAAPTAQAANVFRGLLKQLKIADKVTGTLIIAGEGDAELYRKDIEPFTIADGAVLKLNATIEVAAPSVVIPIVVE